MNRHTTVLETIHARLTDSDAGGTAVIVDPDWVSALTRMQPAPERTCGHDRWVECRTQRLDGARTLFAVISGGRDGDVFVTAHINGFRMAAEFSRISRQILGRPRGVQSAEVRSRGMIRGAELLERTVVNEHGAAFHVGGLYLDAGSSRIVIDLLDVDEDDNPIPGTECGIYSLDGWEVY